MKNRFKYIGVFFFAGLVLLSCKDDDNGIGPKTAEQLATESLAGPDGSQTWTVANGGTVTKDGSSETANYANFELRFIANNTGRSYTTSGGGMLFDASGNWNLEGDNFDKIILAGNQPAANKEISFTRNQDNLRLEFTISAPENSRVMALAGYYIFDLKLKQ
ncbi:hypothetical protein [Negadavirga shengliensis]|uniref:Lipocalin-like domain-containing protein n=1 Tax=Negadavirga shengliensis TaxID=1389218 RepID=A0ABV9T6I0_9BACT